MEQEVGMAIITIHIMDDEVKRRLRTRAAAKGRPLEEEARQILPAALEDTAPPINLAAAIRSRVVAAGKGDLGMPPRASMRPPPAFDRG